MFALRRQRLWIGLTLLVVLSTGTLIAMFSLKPGREERIAEQVEQSHGLVLWRSQDFGKGWRGWLQWRLSELRNGQGLKPDSIIEIYFGKHSTARPESLTNRQLAVIAGLPDLDYLNLDGAVNISDEGLRVVESLPLKSLSLFDVPLTDEGLRSIARCGQLRLLAIDARRVSDKGIAALSTLGKLRGLYMSGSTITRETAIQLSKFTGLFGLNLEQCKIDSETAQFLRQSMPECGIEVSRESPQDRGEEVASDGVEVRP